VSQRLKRKGRESKYLSGGSELAASRQATKPKISGFPSVILNKQCLLRMTSPSDLTSQGEMFQLLALFCHPLKSIHLVKIRDNILGKVWEKSQNVAPSPVKLLIF
jgi:hypothetical protein